MKLKSLIVGIVPLLLLTAPIALAQQPAGTRPAPAGSSEAGFPDGKIAIVDTEEFGNQKTGIVRLTKAFEAIEREFTPERDQLQKMRAQYDQLVNEIEATKNAPNPRTLAGKVDQAETLKKQIERRAQDAQDAYTRRLRELTEPIWKDISTALEAYARQRGISVVFDVSKLGEVMMVINNSVDLTKGFVDEYNRRNPASATPAKP